jgi:hypothetical protein
MEMSENKFKLLATLDKYEVKFHDQEYDTYVQVSVTNSRRGGVYYWFRLNIDKTFAFFEQRYSQNNGRCDRGWTCGYNFRQRMERDLQKANLI